ncbi:radical SAM protein [Heliobacillus mobilis]|uniref:Radical SAM protein n=1 Tax=Heliobacterium mobile TaxID=28064 RepID=A0A6I3SKR0_HELMO|nr:radical SAM protein [Heliobacterium mobile]MTV49521.1 radical SAM protein [Heliobacterium mobile]
MASFWRQWGHYARFALPFLLGQQDVPLILGLVVTDRCNLACKDCRVANTGRSDMTFTQIQEKLLSCYQRGFRELYIEGGEPFLWRDHDYRLDDVVEEARRIGFFHVHIYTNGHFPLQSRADLLWVSVDGLRDYYARIRGDHFEKVRANMFAAPMQKKAVVYTVNQLNRDHIEAFLQTVHLEKWPVAGVMFYFHTPYYGIDELFIPAKERSSIIDELIQHKQVGLPVYNSISGLRLLQSGNWRRPSRTYAIIDQDGEYLCCRYNSPELCRECGYGACTEVAAAQQWHVDAWRNLAGFL